MNLILPSQQGFTLTELMIALAVAAILAALAVPSFFETVRTSRLTAQTDELIATLNLGRSEARKSGARVSLCRSADGNTCATTGGWEQGWVLFVDTDSDGAHNTSTTPPIPEPILRVQQALPPGYSLRASAALANVIGFLPNGDITANGLLVNCFNTTLAGARAVTVNTGGAVRQLADTDGDKIPNNGANIGSCTAP